MGAASERGARGLAVGALPHLLADPVPAIACAVWFVLGAAVFFSGGSLDSPLLWIGGAAIVLAAAAAVSILVGFVAVPAVGALGAAAVVLFAAFIAWNGVSIAWSVEPDRSWQYLNRGLVYLAFLGLGLVVGMLPRARRVVAYGLSLLLGAAVVAALAGKVFPGLASDTSRVARLQAPVSYWNALALLLDTALPLALWLATAGRHSRGLRVAGTLLVYAASVALLLTLSRAGIAIGVLSVLVWLAAGPSQLESGIALAIAGVPAAAVAGWAFTRPGLVDDLKSHSLRVRDGGWFGLALALGGIAVVAAAYAWVGRGRLEGARRTLAGRILVAAGALALLAALVALVAGGARPSSLLKESNSGPTRLASVSSNNRSEWWHEAWTAFKEKPVAGTGAGSFVVTHRRLRSSPTFTPEPHNVWLQFLSETGIVGFVLLLAATLAAAVAIVRSLRVRDEDRAPGVALAIALLAYVLHSIVDFDWDFVAVTAPFLLVAGSLLVAGRREPGRRGLGNRLWAASAAAVAVAAIYSLAAPWLADRRVNAAYASAFTAPAHAIALAKSAHSLDPLAIEPLLAWAGAEQARGDDAAAERLYERATQLQPQSWRAWYDLAAFRFGRSDRAGTQAALARALPLDPHGPANELNYSFFHPPTPPPPPPAARSASRTARATGRRAAQRGAPRSP